VTRSTLTTSFFPAAHWRRMEHALSTTGQLPPCQSDKNRDLSFRQRDSTTFLDSSPEATYALLRFAVGIEGTTDRWGYHAGTTDCQGTLR